MSTGHEQNGAEPTAAPPAAGVAEAPPAPRRTFYRLNNRRVTFEEFRRSAKLPTAILAWFLVKVLRADLPCSSDDPAVHDLSQFPVAALPESVLKHMNGPIAELTAAGFGSPAYHSIDDHLHATGTYLASFSHASLPVVARVHLRVWARQTPPAAKLFVEFVTPYADGGYLWTLSGKFDALAPAACHVVRRETAAPGQLWAVHQEEMAKEPRDRRTLPTRDAATVLETLHAAVREFHVMRGAFAPRTVADEARADAAMESRKRAREGGSKYPGVLLELDRMQRKQTGWLGPLVILAISIVAFVLIGMPGQRSWGRMLGLVPILLFHECGHYIAMRLCGYKNLRMFFIPGFGAAVTGRAFNVAGWKKAVVSLMGPVPGIALGIVIGLTGIVLKRQFAVDAALLILVLNGINLLPVLPLDGGHVAHTVLFSRHHVLDAVFRLIAAAVLIGGGMLLNTRILWFLGIMLVVSLGPSLRLTKVAQELKKSGFKPVSPDDQTIPPLAAETIIERLKASSKRPIPDKILAQQTQQVFESLNTKPPGVLASIGLLSVHAVSFMAAVVFGLVFVMSQNGSLRDFVRTAVAAPKHTLATGPIRHAGQPGTGPANTVVATFARAQGADAAYTAAVGQLGEGESLEQFGDTVLVRLPESDAAGRQKWLDRLQGGAADVFVDGEAMHAAFRFHAIAPDEAAAKAIESELHAYFSLPLSEGLTAPWIGVSPAVRLSRETYSKLQYGPRADDPALKALLKQMSEARKRGETARAKALSTQYRDLLAELRRKEIEKMAADQSGAVDAAMARDYLALYTTLTPDQLYPAARKELAPRLGPAAPGADGPCARSGYATRTGLIIEMEYTSFRDASAGAAAVKAWLQSKKCIALRYEVEGVSGAPENDDQE